jgi:Tfp pilus assembly major pilin PilA
MNKQRGFIGIGAMIAIIAILAIAGGVTYSTRHKAKVTTDVSMDSTTGVGYERADGAPASGLVITPITQGVAVNIGGQAQADDSSDNTFVNTDGGYSFSVSGNWKAAVNAYNNKNSLFGPSADGRTGLGGVEVSRAASIDAYLAGPAMELTSKTAVTVDGISGIRATYVGTGGKGEQVVLLKDGTIYNIYINSQNDADIRAFAQLVSSFTFN